MHCHGEYVSVASFKSFGLGEVLGISIKHFDAYNRVNGKNWASISNRTLTTVGVGETENHLGKRWLLTRGTEDWSWNSDWARSSSGISGARRSLWRTNPSGSGNRSDLTRLNLYTSKRASSHLKWQQQQKKIRNGRRANDALNVFKFLQKTKLVMVL